MMAKKLTNQDIKKFIELARNFKPTPEQIVEHNERIARHNREFEERERKERGWYAEWLNKPWSTL